MDNFQRPSDSDIPISTNPGGGQPYFAQIPHMSQISSDPSIHNSGQLIGDHSQSNGLIPNMANFNGMNSGVNLPHAQRPPSGVLGKWRYYAFLLLHNTS